MDELALSPPIASPLPVAQRLLSDERLARLVSRGNAQAFATLYARHQRALAGYCRAIVRDEQDAQDALQNAMMHALGALQAGERELKVRPWLYRIAHNESVSLLRRRRAAESLSEGEEIPGHDAVEVALETRERLTQLVADLQTLSERQRAALVMRELSGLSAEEIAAALGTSPGAAKQTLFEARCALHELAEGRAMECDAVRQLVSEHDGRVMRGRRVRAHLRACASCRAFRGSIELRTADLRAFLPPLPALGAAGLAARLLGGAHGGAGAGSTGAGALGGGLLGSGSLAVKALTGVALLTAVSAGTVELTTATHTHRAHHALTARQAEALAPAATRPLETKSALDSWAAGPAGRGAQRRASARSGGGAAQASPIAGTSLPPATPDAAVPVARNAPTAADPAPASSSFGSSGSPSVASHGSSGSGGGAGGGSGSTPHAPRTQPPSAPPAQVPGQAPSGGHADPPANPGPPATGGGVPGSGAEHSHAGDAPDDHAPPAGSHGPPAS
jgi:RNA polymerase sigma factor (sigma-70 family)